MIKFILVSLLLSGSVLSRDSVSIGRLLKDDKVIDIRIPVDEVLKVSVWEPGDPFPVPIDKIVSSTIDYFSKKNVIIIINRIDITRDKVRHNGEDVFYWYYRMWYQNNDGSSGCAYRLLNGKFIKY